MVGIGGEIPTFVSVASGDQFSVHQRYRGLYPFTSRYLLDLPQTRDPPR